MADEMIETIDAAAEEAAGAEGNQAPHSLADLQPKMKLSGTVIRLELYGAFIDLGLGVDAILHVSKLGERVNRVADVLGVGDQVTVWIDKVDLSRNQITVSMLEPPAVDWSELREGQVYTGKVTRLEPFGAFVDIGADKEGLVHVSELSHEYLKHPSHAVKVGDELEVMVRGVNKRRRRIDLSHKALLEPPETQMRAQPKPAEIVPPDEPEIELPTAMEVAMREAMEGAGVPLPPPKGTGKRRTKRGRRRQDDILERTLKMNRDRDN
ncbi:MAG: S1 RNA-binding domain-containing protein [Candidatus Promineifilaceae bacterium]